METGKSPILSDCESCVFKGPNSEQKNLMCSKLPLPEAHQRTLHAPQNARYTANE